MNNFRVEEYVLSRVRQEAPSRSIPDEAAAFGLHCTTSEHCIRRRSRLAMGEHWLISRTRCPKVQWSRTKREQLGSSCSTRVRRLEYGLLVTRNCAGIVVDNIDMLRVPVTLYVALSLLLIQLFPSVLTSFSLPKLSLAQLWIHYYTVAAIKKGAWYLKFLPRIIWAKRKR